MNETERAVQGWGDISSKVTDSQQRDIEIKGLECIYWTNSAVVVSEGLERDNQREVDWGLK